MTIRDYDLAAEALLDDGYSEEEIEQALGPRPVPRTAAGRDLFDPQPRLLDVLEEFRVEEEEREMALASSGKNSRPAPELRRVTLSRGGKILRIAQAMAKLRGHAWWMLTEEQRDGYTRLATFAVEALEAVEEDEVALRRSKAPTDAMDTRIAEGRS